MLLSDYSIASADMFLLASQLDYDEIASFKLCDVSESEYEQLRNHPHGDLLVRKACQNASCRQKSYYTT